MSPNAIMIYNTKMKFEFHIDSTQVTSALETRQLHSNQELTLFDISLICQGQGHYDDLKRNYRYVIYIQRLCKYHYIYAAHNDVPK